MMRLDMYNTLHSRENHYFKVLCKWNRPTSEGSTLGGGSCESSGKSLAFYLEVW